MTRAWVIGSNGLLGSALHRNLAAGGDRLYSPACRFAWNEPDRLARQFRQEVATFANSLEKDESWQIYWAAGIGTFNSTQAEMQTETGTLSMLLQLITGELGNRPGTLVFSSSAGAIYAGSGESIITEHTPVAPTTDYAREKLHQEDLISAFIRENPGVSALLARISTLYGAGQAHGKKQGLIAHIARCIIRNRPVNIFVPLDTIRDYITADDAAALIVATAGETGSGCRIKIIASEQPVTIAEIVSVFKKIARRRPGIIASTGKLTGLYTRRVQFRSRIPPSLQDKRRTSLFIGISQVMASERLTYARQGETGEKAG